MSDNETRKLWFHYRCMKCGHLLGKGAILFFETVCSCCGTKQKFVGDSGLFTADKMVLFLSFKKKNHIAT